MSMSKPFFQKLLLVFVSAFISAMAWSAEKCDGKDAKVINTDDSEGTVRVYGTSGNDVIALTGKNSATVYVLFDVDPGSTPIPAGGANGGNDKLCILNKKISAFIYIHPEYHSYVRTEGPFAVIQKIKSTDGGSLKFIADYAGTGPHIYSVAGTDAADDYLIFAPDSTGYSQIASGDGDDLIALEENQPGGGNYVNAGDGDDTIMGSGVNDILIGGKGKDTLYGNGGDDLIIGSKTTRVSTGYFSPGSYAYDAKYISENSPKDAYEDDVVDIDKNDSRSEIHGGPGDDVLLGGNEVDEIEGDAGNDWIYGYAGNDQLHLGAESGSKNGEYEISFLGSSITLNIFTLVDKDGGKVVGGSGGDTIWGSDGKDNLTGNSGTDFIYAMGGNDSIDVKDCNDTDYAFGMHGADKISYCEDDYVFTASTNGFHADDSGVAEE